MSICQDMITVHMPDDGHTHVFYIITDLGALTVEVIEYCEFGERTEDGMAEANVNVYACPNALGLLFLRSAVMAACMEDVEVETVESSTFEGAH